MSLDERAANAATGEVVNYPDDIDPECVALCDAINRIPGLRTTESCCGHGRSPFRVYFAVDDQKRFPVLLYYLDPCHVGFRWLCLVRTDCGMSPAYYYIESEAKGQEAYDQANEVARCIHGQLDADKVPQGEEKS